MKRGVLGLILLVAGITAAQTQDSDIPVLKRRPAPSNSSTQPVPEAPVAPPQPAPSAPPVEAPAPEVAPAPEAAPVHTDTTRVIILTRSGGVLRVTVADPSDLDGAGQISVRLRNAAARYARGELNSAVSAAPGTAVMRQMHSRIIYTAHAIDGGGELIISSQDSKAIEAIHQFLEYQQARR